MSNCSYIPPLNVSDLYSECLIVVTGLTCISCTTVLSGKCQSRLTEGTVWDKELAMAPVIIHPSKEPDGEGKVSVKILFLDWGVYLRSHSRALSISLCPCLSQSFSLVLSSSLSNPPPAVFYQILSQGASYKTNRAHQDRAPEDRFGQPSLIYHGPGWVEA